MGGSSVIHALMSLPRQAWWLIAILAGLSLLGSGGQKKKKKKKKDSSSFAAVIIVGVVLLAAGTGGGVTKVIQHHGLHVPSASGSCSRLGEVPASMINGAGKSLGISCTVVRAQINEESGGMTHYPDGRPMLSPTGAMGVAQFEPGTWNGHHCPGSPWNVGDAMNCYVIYMRELIGSEGSLRNALAAYNAGPGNLGAGYGYADTIMSAAGV
jgi:hypothetical protein